MSRTILSLKNITFALTAGVLTAMTTGCGIGTPAAPTDTTIASISGVIRGGHTPIQGTRVILYHTTSTGYGTGAVVIGTALTAADGSFAITPSATAANCPAAQQAYITAAGGYQTGQSTLTNTSMLEIAALGPCSGISSSTSVVINEATTVAAGFALSGFLTTAVDGTYQDGQSKAIYAANIGAPAANNAATITATTPAGLAHAFLNAAALASYITGNANSSVSVTTNGGTTTGSVPQVLINSLADAVQACVDSASTPSALSTNCSSLFADTVSASGVTPNNTLQAMAYLARNPYTAAGVNATTGLLALGKGISGAFLPALTNVPSDWSMAIVYNGGLAAPYFVALDANDTAYFGLTTTSPTLPAAFGLSAYGATLPAAFGSPATGTTTHGIAPDALGNIWVATYGSSASSLYRLSASTGAISTAYMTAQGYSWPVAVDASNNVWVGQSVASGVVLDRFGYSSGAGTWTLDTEATPTAANSGSYGISIDANQNVWSASYYTGGTTAVMLPNSGSVAAPVYTGTTTAGIDTVSNILSATTGTKPYSVAIDSAGNAWYAIYSGGTTATAGVQQVQPNSYTLTTPVTAITAQTQVAATAAGTNGNVLGTAAPLEVAMDGASTLFIPDNSTSGVHMYSTTASQTLTEATGLVSAPETVSAVAYTAGAGCTAGTYPLTFTSTSTTGSGAAATATVASTNKVTSITITSGGSGYVTAPTVAATTAIPGCTTAPTFTASVNAVYNPRQVAIDSTGSIWMGYTTGGATEIIGVAAPSFPLLSTGKPGLSPGLTAVNPLP